MASSEVRSNPLQHWSNSRRWAALVKLQHVKRCESRITRINLRCRPHTEDRTRSRRQGFFAAQARGCVTSGPSTLPTQPASDVGINVSALPPHTRRPCSPPHHHCVLSPHLLPPKLQVAPSTLRVVPVADASSPSPPLLPAAAHARKWLPGSEGGQGGCRSRSHPLKLLHQMSLTGCPSLLP